jgi:hypothetical protein
MVIYAAVYDDVNAAIEAVKAQCLEGDEIGEAAPLRKETVQSLKAAPGQVWML